MVEICTFLFLEKSFYSLFKHHFSIKGPPFSRFIFDTLALINTINLFQWNWELILDNNQTGYFRQFIGFLVPGKLGKLKSTPLYSAIKMHYLMPAKNIKIAKLCYITRLSRTPKYKVVFNNQNLFD